MINNKIMERILRSFFPKASSDFIFFAKFGGAYDSDAFEPYGDNMRGFYTGNGIIYYK